MIHRDIAYNGHNATGLIDARDYGTTSPIQTTASPPAAQPPPQLFNRFTIRSAALGVALGGLAFGLLAVIGALSVFATYALGDRALPGVTAAGVPLGRMTQAEAAQALETAWSGSGATVALTDGAQTWRAAPAALGFTLDAQATAQQAVTMGREGGAGPGLFDVLLHGASVAPVISYDDGAARSALETLASSLSQPAQDATLKIDGGQVTAVAGQPGRALDVDATLAAWRVEPGALVAGGSLPLVFTPVAPRIADASAALAEAQPLLSAPLSLRLYDPFADQGIERSIPPEDIATWLDLNYGEDGLHVSVDADKVSAYLSQLAGSLLTDGRTVDTSNGGDVLLRALRTHAPATLTVHYPPTIYTVEAGDTLISISWKVGMPFWRIANANPDVNPDALTVGQQLTIPSLNDLLPLPVIPNKRIVVSITDQHLWVYENGQQVNDFVISTGIDRSPTQPGIFQVQTHELNAYASLWDLYMPHFLGIYEAWPGFMNGFHGLPTLSGGRLLWADVLGHPASFGCIILNLDAGEWLYNWAEDGVVVEIRR